MRKSKITKTARGWSAIDAIQADYEHIPGPGSPVENAMTRLLCDLMHLSHRQPEGTGARNFDRMLTQARILFADETAKEKTGETK